MPLEEEILSREPDGTINEDYCRWCYTQGEFVYKDMQSLLDYCASHMANEAFPETQVRAYLAQLLPTLAHWKEQE